MFAPDAPAFRMVLPNCINAEDPVFRIPPPPFEAEFPVSVGWFRVTTLERVSLDPDRHRITFEQLRSPFFSVRTATEVFELSSLTGGGTLVRLKGNLSPRLGLFGWLVTRFVVRPHWDEIDGNFLRRLRKRIASAEG